MTIYWLHKVAYYVSLSSSAFSNDNIEASHWSSLRVQCTSMVDVPLPSKGYCCASCNPADYSKLGGLEQIHIVRKTSSEGKR